MITKNLKIIVFVISFIFLLSCDNGSDGSDLGPTTPPEIQQRLYFTNQSLTVNRSQSQPLTIDLRYEGPQTTETITVGYEIEVPNDNGAVEGKDFELPNSSSFTILNGQALTDVTLIQRVLFNEEATENRFVSFRIKDKEGFLTTNASGAGNIVTVTIGPTDDDTESNDPNDPDDFIGDKKFTFTGETGSTLKIPYFSNVDNIRDTNNENIKRAVVVLQGARRNAGSYYRSMLGAAEMESTQLDTILIVSPQFVIEDDINEFVLDDEHIYWESTWKTGANSRNESSNPRPERIPSFTVMDSLMLKIAEYPNLEKIVFTGHSAGGQYVNRYAASSPIVDELQNSYGVELSFIVNNPSSYIYMDDKRKVPGTQNTFAVPSTSCSNYNEYKYGLDELFTYLRETGGGAETIRERLITRKVTYLVGQEDNDPNASLLDRDCEALLQGDDRLERGINYFDHLLDFYGSVIEENQSFGIVPGVGHSSRGMFQSEKGRAAAFRN